MKLFLVVFCFVDVFCLFGFCVDGPMMKKLDGGTHTGEVYLTVPLEWQGAGSGCWLGREIVELEAMIRVGLGYMGHGSGQTSYYCHRKPEEKNGVKCNGL